ncbi:MAG: nucleotidyltransferase domain-containing protein [Candidatus Aenigmarchaeota archaeon]|nr:nucleotidyltransferase domain-containing protein [Candidatus Aenigmarchaeota archaeon]
MGKKEVKKEIIDFLQKVKEKFEPEKVILFGSRAKGEYLKHSDYDFIIVSKKFEGMNFLKRMEKVYELWDKDVPMDVLCYTPKEFEKKRKEIGIVREALKKGVELK